MISNIMIGKDLLETITSALYENPIVLFREYVQNSVDAYKKATKEEQKPQVEDFHVSINIEETEKKIVIKDNGYGIGSYEEFTKRMVEFANSDKSDRSQYIGFRGIGRLSAMPFCKTLIFENKAEGSNKIDVCKWEGSKYRDLLNSEATDIQTFEDIVKSVADIHQEEADDRLLSEHYFKVIIVEYVAEVDDVIKNVKFEQKLRQMLPLKYSEEFPESAKIMEKYKEFMEEDLNDFSYSVKLNGNELRKNYTSKYVLESDILFWEIRGKSGPTKRPGERIGILWFTFNKKIMSNLNDTDYGILVRSKNMLMGDNDTFADLCVNSKEYVTTYSQLTQALRGTYGELLINSPNLRDNARREWFKTDEHSYYLKNIIIDFMKRFNNYRNRASKYFNNVGQENKKLLKEALVELVDVDTNHIDVNAFYEVKEVKDERDNTSITTESGFLFADEDIPRQSQTKKKTYEELMKVMKAFFEKEKQYEIFLKLRAYIKNHFNE